MIFDWITFDASRTPFHDFMPIISSYVIGLIESTDIRIVSQKASF